MVNRKSYAAFVRFDLMISSIKMMFGCFQHNSSKLITAWQTIPQKFA